MMLNTATIWVADDDAANLHFFDGVLTRAGYAVVPISADAGQVSLVMAGCVPDLLIVNLGRCCAGALAILSGLRAQAPVESGCPVLVLTSGASPETKLQALSLGANDFLTAPFDPTEVLMRVRNLLENARRQRQLQAHTHRLEAEVRACVTELEETRLDLLDRLAAAVAQRDDVTGRHSLRVGETAARLARTMGLDAAQVEMVRRAAPLHDVGKIAIPDRILHKARGLTADEYTRIKTHTMIGAHMLAGSPVPHVQMAAEIARTHHEHWDGSGYLGLRGAEITLPARIVAVADQFDALAHARPYKQAWPEEDAVAEIVRQSGRHFDPYVVEAFVAARMRGELAGAGAETAAAAPPADGAGPSQSTAVPAQYSVA